MMLKAKTHPPSSPPSDFVPVPQLSLSLSLHGMRPPLPPKHPHAHRAVLSFLSLVLLFFFLLYLSLTPSRNKPSPLPSPPPSSRNAPADSLSDPHRLFLSLSPGANASIAAHLRTLTLRPHLAGTPSAAHAASYVLAHLRSAGLRTLVADYYPLLSYPASASLALLRPDGALLRPLPLAEPADPEAAAVPPYHAYSPSGAAMAPGVFINYGREEDYRALDRLGVDVKGCVVIVRRGGGYRGAVVVRAAARGAVAVLMFKAADRGGVERGTVLLGGVGDPLTPGWAAPSAAAAPDDGGGERLDADEEEVRRRFPKIPSMPVAEAVAMEILRTLGGPPMPRAWRDALPLAEDSGVGPGPTLVNLTYQEDKKLAKIQNVFGVIRGSEEPDRYVILGNHRDAWTFGAVDPNSGTAALLDVARHYGSLLRSGWRPRRTIILCSWEAEEFGMIGSTEWVEQNLGKLTSMAVTYLNVDCAVQGDGFFAGATPQLDKLLVQVTKQIQDPDLEGRTVYDSWAANNEGISKIERLARADSDFSAFLHHAGIPSVDLYYGEAFAGYHTAFDSYKWMIEHGDPSFHRHVAIAELWGLLGLRLADDPVLPFDYLSYSTQLHVDNFGTVNLVEACRKTGVNRFILVSSILVNGAAMGQILNPAYIILNVFGLTLIAKLQAEQYIRRSGINYTIIRPGGLRDEPATGSIIMEPEDTLYEGSISRDQVAEVAVGSLFCPDAFYKVVEIVSRSEAPKRPVSDLFAAVRQS